MMHSHSNARRAGQAARLILPAGALALAAGCNLDVITPTVVPPSSVQGDAALPTLLAGAVGDFAIAYGGFNDGNAGEGIVLNSGLFSDEFVSTDYFSTHKEIDTRRVTIANSSVGEVLLRLQRALRSSEFANAAYTASKTPNAADHARTLSLAGFSYVLIAETYCSGTPFSSLDATGRPVYGPSQSTAQMLDNAIARFDSALTIATAASNSTQRYLAMVGKGRALLDKGQFAAASAAVAGVPDDFVYATEQGTGDDRTKNGVFALTYNSTRYTVADVEGGNGLPFVEAQDPRLVLADSGKSAFDGSTELFVMAKYDSYAAPINIASGTEARLIMAEASLKLGNYAAAKVQLDALRSAAGLAPLAPALTPTAQQDQLFAERAFWLFGTAHRLGDLRRLITQYGRTAQSVFPTGAYFKGGTYGDQVNFLVPQQEIQDNPNYNPASCDPAKA